MAGDSDRTSDYRRLRRNKDQNITRDVSSSSQISGFCKPRISSMFLSSSSPSSSRKNLFSGLGCASPSPVSNSAIVRSSADWQVKKSRRKKKKQRYSSRKQQVNSDVWCGPGMGFDADDCVVSQRPPPSRERIHAQRNHREIMLVEANLPWEDHLYDMYGDLRLDVDNMTYEELIELGERIGTVSTGLKEDDVRCYVRKMKAIDLASSSMCCIKTDRKCSVCLEDYKLKEEIGELKCGHAYHIDCIKQWLTQKNACPVCKASASKF